MLLYSGIQDIWRIYNLSIQLSPLDGDGMPSIYPALHDVLEGKVVNMDRDDFFLVINHFLNKMRDQVHHEREIARNKAKTGKGSTCH